MGSFGSAASRAACSKMRRIQDASGKPSRFAASVSARCSAYVTSAWMFFSLISHAYRMVSAWRQAFCKRIACVFLGNTMCK